EPREPESRGAAGLHSPDRSVRHVRQHVLLERLGHPAPMKLFRPIAVAAMASAGLPSARSTPAAEQLFPADELHARAAVRLAERALMGIDRLPAGVFDERQAALHQESLEVALPAGEQAGVGVFEHVLDRLGGVLLVGADDAARAALDP